LYWLNILAVRDTPADVIVREHWQRFGRNVYSRHDYEGIETALADRLIDGLRARLPQLPGSLGNQLRIAAADDFSYTDPVDGSRSERQGIRIMLEDGSRVVFRLSGTGTEGATLRVYLERFVADASRHEVPTQEALAPLIGLAEAVAQISTITGRTAPDVIS
ncbi:MAG: alpha-D-glucose phosphate-specific phosphoglucomutase, partial [Candidatus Accumulibacter sp.]|nr:alpha-D-glucose phosphate-specific phosphoglucomutase [Accumulibacter sp.]